MTSVRDCSVGEPGRTRLGYCNDVVALARVVDYLENPSIGLELRYGQLNIGLLIHTWNTP